MNHLDEERKKSEKKISDLTKRLALSDAEKERAIMTRNQTHELLVESKTKISEQEDEIQKLKVDDWKTLLTVCILVSLSISLFHTQTNTHTHRQK